MNWLGIAAHALVILAVTPHILLNKRDPRSASLWLLTIWFMPLVGYALYWAFGMNRLARKARRLKNSGQVALAHPSQRLARSVAGLEPLKLLSDSLASYPLLAGNDIQPLVNGTQAYPSMLKAMAKARKSLAMCSYIFDHSAVGMQFLQALDAAARRGVQVRLLVDGIGAWGLGPELTKTLSQANVKVASFWPYGRWLKHSGINLRNHRKILVVDGEVGFTGGLNISSHHVGRGSAAPLSRDIHFKITGPVVRHLTDTFARDWQLAEGEQLGGKDWFPELKPGGQMIARGLAAGPDHDFEKIYELVLGALRTARQSIDLMTPYFIPDPPILASLRSAGRSGVKVRLFLPRHSDRPFMNWAARGYLEDLFDCGVEIWEIWGGFIHSKLMVVDGQWVLLGSANLDPRSFRLNFEFNLEAYSKPLAARVTRYLNGHLLHSNRVDRDTLKRESLAAKLRNQAVKLFSPYL